MKYRILISEREAKTMIEALERINALTGVFILPKEKELLERLKHELVLDRQNRSKGLKND